MKKAIAVVILLVAVVGCVPAKLKDGVARQTALIKVISSDVDGGMILTHDQQKELLAKDAQAWRLLDEFLNK